MNPTDPSPAQADEFKPLGGRVWLWLCVVSFTLYFIFSEGLRGHVAFLTRAVGKVLEHLT